MLFHRFSESHMEGLALNSVLLVGIGCSLHSPQVVKHSNENGASKDEFTIKIPIDKGFSMAMLTNQMVSLLGDIHPMGEITIR